MNQQLKDFGHQKKIPASVLKWIWDNKETLLAIIKLLFPERDMQRAEAGCLTPRPAPKLTPGYWSCIDNEWTWIEDLG